MRQTVAPEWRVCDKADKPFGRAPAVACTASFLR
jgi:hypothetical protein